MVALVFGGTGLVGKHTLDQLLNDEGYEKIIAIGRSTLNIQNKKLIEKIINFDNLQNETLEDTIDHVYLCLGTTMAKAGSKAKFYQVDYRYTLEAAKWAKKYGATKAALVSAIGSSSQSWFYYSKVKGEVERDILALDYETTIIIRPSLLLGARNEYRKGEVMAERMSQYLGFLYSGPMAKYKPVKAMNVASKMINTLKNTNQKIEIIESQNI